MNLQQLLQTAEEEEKEQTTKVFNQEKSYHFSDLSADAQKYAKNITIENDSHQKDDVQKYHSDTNSPKFFKKLLNINDIDFVKNEINTSEQFELKTDKKTSEEYFKKSLPSPESNGNRDQIKQARKNKS